MTKPYPNCTVLKDAQRQTYFVEALCVDKHTGILTNWRPLIALSKEDMVLHGFDVVMRELREFSTRDSDQRSVPASSTPEGRRDAKWRRASVPVSVELKPDGSILLTPCARWSRSAWTFLTDRAATLSPPIPPAEFINKLELAFDQCVAAATP
jgi:hypothetical protein